VHSGLYFSVAALLAAEGDRQYGWMRWLCAFLSVTTFIHGLAEALK